MRRVRSVRSRLALPAAPILFLDDKLENVEGARATGWQAAHVPRPAELGSTLNRCFDGIAA
jgi:FMN phosphatase YigB (HAD superfamily)